NDSKLLQPRVREVLRNEIEAHALAFAVAFIDHQTIDKVNILNATFLAMNKAVNDLSIRPDRLLIDGNRFSNQTGIPHVCLIKGDSIYRSIAAASILAKTQRDAFMNEIHEEYPQYNWKKNKGYATHEHLLAIARHGLSPYHRVSFRSSIQWKLF
ncbi:MAG: ribonuclease HII, partial [Bacteroidetes bacterium]|nr:ribonuclease HII [Bacteroidota bacterium]